MIVHSPQELALYVNNHRKKLKISQTAVSDSVGIKQATLSAFENKPESTKLETLFSILAALNLDLRVSSKDDNSDKQNKWTEEW